MRRLLCWFGCHKPGHWHLVHGEIPWAYCVGCGALLHQDSDGGYFQ